MAKIYKSISEYIRGISSANSDALGWKSIRVWVAADGSNCVRFSGLSKNTVKVTLSGTARHTLRVADFQDARATRPGEAILLHKGSSAELSWITTGAVEDTIVIELDDDFFERYYPEAGPNFLPTRNLVPTGYSNKPEVVTLIKMLARELDPTTSRGSRFSEITIRLLAYEIARSDWFYCQRELVQTFNVNARINKIISMIEAEFTTNISLTDLTHAGCLSQSHLITLFKRRTGRTPYAYIVDCRIKRAVELLRTTAWPIAAVAIESGFADQSQMTRMFQKRVGLSPRALRMRAREAEGKAILGDLDTNRADGR